MSSNEGCWHDRVGRGFSDIEERLFEDLRHTISRKKRVGKVIKIKDDIISVKLKNLNIKEDMILPADTVFDLITDGCEIGISDSKDGIKYYKDLNNKDDDSYIEMLEMRLETFTKLSNIPKDSLPFDNISQAPFGYTLKVIQVIDSIAITKRINIKRPFVKVRVGDQVNSN